MVAGNAHMGQHEIKITIARSFECLYLLAGETNEQ
jgi:hypothetical protein